MSAASNTNVATSTIKPIKLYSLNTPNVAKVFIFLKLLEVPFETIYINIKKGDQFTDDYIKINPNSKVPAIVDPNVIGETGKPLTVWESGNILIYLAKKYAKNGQYLPDESTRPQAHYEVLNWVFLQMSTLGPHFGNYFHYKFFADEKIEYSLKRHYSEVRRLFNLFNRQLEKHAYIAGDELSIADLAIFPWTRIVGSIPDIVESDFPKLFEYNNRLSQLEATKAYIKYDEELKAANPQKPFTEEERKFLFNRDK